MRQSAPQLLSRLATMLSQPTTGLERISTSDCHAAGTAPHKTPLALFPMAPASAASAPRRPALEAPRRARALLLLAPSRTGAAIRGPLLALASRGSAQEIRGRAPFLPVAGRCASPMPSRAAQARPSPPVPHQHAPAAAPFSRAATGRHRFATLGVAPRPPRWDLPSAAGLFPVSVCPPAGATSACAVAGVPCAPDYSVCPTGKSPPPPPPSLSHRDSPHPINVASHRSLNLPRPSFRPQVSPAPQSSPSRSPARSTTRWGPRQTPLVPGAEQTSLRLLARLAHCVPTLLLSKSSQPTSCCFFFGRRLPRRCYNSPGNCTSGPNGCDGNEPCQRDYTACSTGVAGGLRHSGADFSFFCGRDLDAASVPNGAGATSLMIAGLSCWQGYYPTAWCMRRECFR